MVIIGQVQTLHSFIKYKINSPIKLGRGYILIGHLVYHTK